MSDYTPTTDNVRFGFVTAPMAHEPREYAEAEFDRWLAKHDREVAARALEDAAGAFDLDVASARFIASDGVPSVGINTNDEARKLVTDWLRARAREAGA